MTILTIAGLIFVVFLLSALSNEPTIPDDFTPEEDDKSIYHADDCMDPEAIRRKMMTTTEPNHVP